MPQLTYIDKVSIAAGYKDINDLTIRFIAPVVGATLLVSIIFYFLPLPVYYAAIIMAAGLLFSLAYPFAMYGAKLQDINNRLHLFITYSGTISTMDIDRHKFFEKVAEKEVFGEISRIFNKIQYIAIDWNLGFARACRKVASTIPSQLLADFLDRLAVVLDFGQNLGTFIHDEQKSVMDDYEVEYMKSLETVRFLQEIFMSLSVSLALIMGILLLSPMLMEFPVFTMMLYALAGVFFMDICFVILVKNYVPYDSMFIDTGVRNESQKQLWQITMATVIVCPILFLFLLQFTELNTLWLFAISTTPLIIPSWIARQEEKLVRKRDRNFPIYARVLGTAISVRNGGVMSALLSTQVHDFGVLNDMSINLYRRLRLGFNKFKSWFYFGKESGSNLIFHFSRIFSQSVYLGGNATEIGEIISTNLQRILALRKQRWQLIGGLRGVFYGSLFGLVATMYTTITISQMFLGAFDIETEGLTSFVDTILPTADVNYASIMILISILILIHAAMTSWLIKLIDGGPVQASFLDFNLMIWISALLSWTVPMLVRSVLPNLSGVT